MAKEIERKFLVDVDKWNKTGVAVKMQQGYLSVQDKKTVRVRIAGNHAYLTIKGNLNGITRDEFEYEIPVRDASQLMTMCIGNTVEKTRYVEEFEGKVWEVDVFEGANIGLVVAEIELESEIEVFVKPHWVLNEVSTDGRYFNFNLSQMPYSKW